MALPLKEMPEWLERLQSTLGYQFRNIDLATQALTHRSYVHENSAPKAPDNERLEFLGDAILNLAVGHLIMERFQDQPEGQLSRLRALIVNEKTLSLVSGHLGLGRFIFLGKGEHQTGGREKASILANCYEAILGAVYLDSSYEEAFKVVQLHFDEYLAKLELKTPRQDCKSLLQEHVQDRHRVVPRYRLVEESGPDHNKTFCVSVSVQGIIMGQGEGKSKKEAEQRAARNALERLKSLETKGGES